MADTYASAKKVEWRRAEEAAGGDGELYIVVKECSVERGVTTVMTMGGLEREREKVERHVKKCVLINFQ